ncbi:MAG TPA: pilus assembly protein TadG-related protein [Candidatus Limnocylindrales bacterium]|nr:pilus assembly protein TadG-related protein [Candidatus Limnocylindrales bacterium]
MRRALRPGTGGPARGQALVIFALSIFVFIGMCAVVVDVAWYWSGMLRMQRAADAAALAGVVYLPGNAPSAVTTARSEASKNGFTDGTGGVIVTAAADVANNRALRVSVRGSVPTFFMRVFGITSIAGARDAKAEYVLPVPMGSPESTYGIFGKIRTPDGGTYQTTTVSGTTDPMLPTTSPSGNWTTPFNATSDNDSNASATQNAIANPYQAWSGFNIAAPGTGTLSVDGIEVSVRASAGAAGCMLNASLSPTGSNVTGSGITWTAAQPLTLADGATWTTYPAGGPTATWGRTWSESQLSNSNFRVRLQYTGTGCTTGTLVSVDAIWVTVSWTRTTTVWVPDQPIAGPNGETLTARGFWGTMLSQGAADINGDAYLPYYENVGGATNTHYQPDKFYDYAVYVPAGAANGQLQVFDAGFCGTDGGGQYGTGDRWFGGTGAVSAFYTLYDTQETLYDTTDDTVVADSGTLFRRIQAADASLYGGSAPAGVGSCEAGDVSDPADGRYWHNRWWPMVNNLTGGSDGKTYRLRTSSTDPNNSTDQRNSNAMNSFALWSSASGGSPRVYGLGAMETYEPLPKSASSIFYLAQIDAVHAGKTLVISLWDPGDTPLDMSSSVQILIPGSAGYSAASLKWSAAKGTAASNVSACTGAKGTGTSITANLGNGNASGQKFNGCWVTIEVPIPASYAADTPPGEMEPGWWKIKYTTGASTSAYGFDVTTWQVIIRGNPVHLVLP